VLSGFVTGAEKPRISNDVVTQAVTSSSLSLVSFAITVHQPFYRKAGKGEKGTGFVNRVFQVVMIDQQNCRVKIVD
jgi:hypothetical protein